MVRYVTTGYYYFMGRISSIVLEVKYSYDWGVNHIWGVVRIQPKEYIDSRIDLGEVQENSTKINGKWD